MRRKKRSPDQISKELQFERIKAEGYIRDKYPHVKALHFDLTFVDSDNQVPPINKKLSLGPQQHAYFGFECPYWECVGGGFDLQGVVDSMLRKKQPECSGELKCMGWQDLERVGKHHCYCILTYRVVAEYQ